MGVMIGILVAFDTPALSSLGQTRKNEISTYSLSTYSHSMQLLYIENVGRSWPFLPQISPASRVGKLPITLSFFSGSTKSPFSHLPRSRFEALV